jgi:hypothetical protein
VSSDSIYVLDADVFIEAKNRYYAFDIAPRFWQSLNDYAGTGRIQSIDRIKKQLEDQKDELSEWIKNGNIANAFENSDQPDVIASYQEAIKWVQANSRYSNAAKNSFANDPDGWLVAYAKAKSCILVTHEKSENSIHRVKIPSVCDALGVIYRNTFDMLRELGIQI